jgi:hypothetical protein
MKRFVTSRPPAVDDAGFGPIGELHAHVALIPFLRVGAYFSYDSSPQDVPPARRFLAFGARVKLSPPWPREPWRAWVFAGFGYASVASGEYTALLPLAVPGGAPNPTKVSVTDASGSLLEIPFGVGASYTFLKPFAATLELGNRLGFAQGQDLYNGRSATAPGFPPVVLDPLGQDLYAISITLGVMAEL